MLNTSTINIWSYFPSNSLTLNINLKNPGSANTASSDSWLLVKGTKPAHFLSNPAGDRNQLAMEDSGLNRYCPFRFSHQLDLADLDSRIKRQVPQGNASNWVCGNE